MKQLYFILILSLISGALLAQSAILPKSAILRASLSTLFETTHHTNNRYKVKFSVGHMEGMTKVDHKNHTVTRGFLLPQGSSGT